jgi:hypothetical protein
VCYVALVGLMSVVTRLIVFVLRLEDLEQQQRLVLSALMAEVQR